MGASALKILRAVGEGGKYMRCKCIFLNVFNKGGGGGANIYEVQMYFPQWFPYTGRYI